MPKTAIHPKGDSGMKRPETKYARTADGVYIGYQAFGNGSVDMILNQGTFSRGGPG